MNLPSAKRGNSGLNTTISYKIIAQSPKLVELRSNEARVTINFLLFYQGSSPYIYCFTSDGNCAISAG
jgi:hypothetical protein